MTHGAVHIAEDRSRAAAALRSARAALAAHNPVEAIEQLGWAQVYGVHTPATMRMEIRALLLTGDTPAATALLSRALLHSPNDATLLGLHAQVLFNRHALDDALASIERALFAHPARRQNHILAARIEQARGCLDTAVEHLEYACRLHGGRACPESTHLLFAIAIAQGDLARAARHLSHMPGDQPIMRATLLQAQGRPQHALDILERMLDDSTCDDPVDRDVILTATLRAMQSLDAHSLIDRLLPEIDPNRHPYANATACESLLALGRFEHVLERTAPTSHAVAPVREECLAMRLIAGWMLHETGDAYEIIPDVRTPLPMKRLATLWRTAWLGYAVRQAGCILTSDETTASPLAKLIRSAAATFDRTLSASGTTADRDLIAHHRAVCSLFLNEDLAPPPSHTDPAEASPQPRPAGRIAPARITRLAA